MESCYIHIPFCNKICSYCDFCKLFYNDKLANLYLDSLSNEIDINYRGEELKTIYIGGGTPSSLNYNLLEKLLSILSKLKKSRNYEYTIESNFDSIDHEKLDLIKKFGINRISFGIESIDKTLLKKMNRDLSLDKVIDIISYCKKIGITNINVDLMYAIPGESINTLKKDLEFILGLDVPHISTYSLILEEHTKLFIDGIKPISEDLDALMYDTICSFLEKNGYIHYEISNFSKDGYMSKHNLCYWNNSHYYGFGLGASGYIDNYRYSNTRSMTNYLNNKYIYSREVLNKNDVIYYEVIVGFRLKSGIDKNKFYNKFGNELSYYYDYNDLLKDGLLKENNNHLYIPEEYFYISNSIIVRFLEECKYE